jgi:hypothetical protein
MPGAKCAGDLLEDGFRRSRWEGHEGTPRSNTTAPFGGVWVTVGAYYWGLSGRRPIACGSSTDRLAEP